MAKTDEFEPIIEALETALGRFSDHIGDAIRTVDKKAEQAKSTAIAALRPRAGRPVSTRTIMIRAATARLIAYVHKMDPEVIAERLYGQSVVNAVLNLPEVISKATTSPAMTSTSGWAAELASGVRVSGFALLAPKSTYAALSARGLPLNFNGVGSVRLPARSGANDLAGAFIPEGGAIPVKKGAISAGTISPHLFGVISTYTKEMTQYTVDAFQSIVSEMIEADAATAIDKVLVGATAGTAVQPPGLLNGLTSLTPVTGGGLAAIAGDFANLAAAVPSAVDLIYLANESTRIRALTYAPGLVGLILSAPQIPDKEVIALDAADFVSASADGAFDASEEATYVSDTGMPVPDMLAPRTTSLWQQAIVGLKYTEHVTWGMRQPNRVAFVSGVSW